MAASDQTTPSGPLLVKLVPPRIPSWYVERPALAERLDGAIRYRLTTVVAGAGFGKSTQLGARALANDWAWYTLDHADRSPVTCAGGVLTALRRRLSGLPWLVLPVNAGSDVDAVGDGLASLLAHTLEEVLDEDLVLVLDDVHELEGGSAAMGFVESLVRYAPAGLHIVLASRHEPPFSIVRMRGRGEVLDVTSADLAFAPEDTSARLASALSAVDRGLADSVHEATDGWPAAVQLAAEMLASDRAHEDGRLLGALGSNTGPLFSYLAEEVFAHEPPETVELIRTAAQFDRVTPELCVALGHPSAGRLLADLARRGLVTAPPIGADDWYELHALVREYVLATWPVAPSQTRALHRRAARMFESMGRHREALASLTAAADGGGVMRLIERRWRELTDHAELDAVVQASAVVQPEQRGTRAAFTIAHAHTLRGEFDQALEWLAEVPAAEEDIGVLFQRALVHVNRREPKRALEVLLRAGPAIEAEGEAMVPAFIAYQLLLLGRVDEARRYATRAFAAAGELGEVTTRFLAEAHMSLADIALEDGDLATAERHLVAALEIAEKLGNVLAACSARHRRSMVHLALGRLDEAAEEATRTLALADRIGFSLFQAWAPASRGHAYLALGRLDEAAADFEAARQVYERLRSSAVGVALSGLGDVHRRRGELTLARSAHERALVAAERSGVRWSRVVALSGLASVLIDEDETEAGRCATDALALAQGSYAGIALVAHGWVALRRGDRDAARADAEHALGDARRRGEPARIAEALELRAACEPVADRTRLEEAHAIWTRIGARLDVARLELALARLAGAEENAQRAEAELRRLGVRQVGAGAGLLHALEPPASGPLAIRTLGHFAVLREGRAVTVSEWQSKKARDLLKILVAARGQSVPRDALVELLWPDEDPSKTLNRLSVALNVVRSVLDPDRLLPQDHCVAGDGDAVRLVQAHVAVDLEAFLTAAAAAAQALRSGQPDAVASLERAEALYTGEFLDEDRYEDWAVPTRDEARAAYLDVLHALASNEKRQRSPSTRFHLRALAIDPYDEDTHLELVAMLVAGGRYGEGRRAHRQYVARMREIDVEPAAFPARPARIHPTLSEP